MVAEAAAVGTHEAGQSGDEGFFLGKIEADRFFFGEFDHGGVICDEQTGTPQDLHVDHGVFGEDQVADFDGGVAESKSDTGPENAPGDAPVISCAAVDR